MAKTKNKDAASPIKEPKVQTPNFKKKDKILKAEKIKQAVAKTPPAILTSATPKSNKKNKKQDQNTPSAKQVRF